MAEETIKTRLPKIGDYVTIHNQLCEWHRQCGEIVGISGFANNDSPYMVQRSNYDIWPFALYELELHSMDAAYEGGWIDDYTRQLLKVPQRS